MLCLPHEIQEYILAFVDMETINIFPIKLQHHILFLKFSKLNFENNCDKRIIFDYIIKTNKDIVKYLINGDK